MKTAMPVSRAKTAYGLLSEIRRLILEEPKRYDQTDTITFRGKGVYREEDRPACSTVGCVAGWVCALKVPNLRRKYDNGNIVILDRARAILGLDRDQEDELFGGDRAGGSPQSINHAKRGATLIAKFQAKYATELKAKKV